ncbi:MAG: VOC family protein [Anaerovoracaceae bacterium]
MKVNAKYTTLNVKNLEESVSFYRDTLGFKEGYHVDLDNGCRITIMDSEIGSVELIEGTDNPIGMYSIGTDVDDLDEVLDHLAKRGIQPFTPVVETTVGHMTFIKDPNGVNICLIEHFK